MATEGGGSTQDQSTVIVDLVTEQADGSYKVTAKEGDMVKVGGKHRIMGSTIHTVLDASGNPSYFEEYLLISGVKKNRKCLQLWPPHYSLDCDKIDSGDWGESDDHGGEVTKDGEQSSEEETEENALFPKKHKNRISTIEPDFSWDPTTAWYPEMSNNYGKVARAYNMFFDVFSPSFSEEDPRNYISLLVPAGASPPESVYYGTENSFSKTVGMMINNIGGIYKLREDTDGFGQFDIIRYFLGKYWTRAFRAEHATGGFPIGTEDAGISHQGHPAWEQSQKDIMSKIAPDSIGVAQPQVLTFDFIHPPRNQWYDDSLWTIHPETNTLDATKLPFVINRIEIHNNTGEAVPVADFGGELAYVASKAANDIPFFQLLENRVELDDQSDDKRYKFDHVFEFPTPFSEEQQLAENPSNPSLYAKITPIYNFYHEAYETYVSGLHAWAMNHLPHLLLTVTERAGHDSLQGKLFNEKSMNMPEGFPDEGLKSIKSVHKDFLTLGGNIPDVFVDIVKAGSKIGEQDTQDYFTAWANTASSMDQNALSPFQENLRNQILFPESTEWAQKAYDVEDTQKSFPMMMDVRFAPFQSLDENGTFQPEDSVLDAMMNPAGDTGPMWYTFLRYIISKGMPQYDLGAKYTETTICPTTFQHDNDRVPKHHPAANVELLEFDFYDFLANVGPPYAGSGQGISLLRQAISPITEHEYDDIPPHATAIIPESVDPKLAQAMYYVHPYAEGASGTATGPSRTTFWQDTIEKFKNKFDEIVKKKTRSYLEILGGETAPVEVLFWKVSKYADGLPDGTDVQLHVADFYFPNMPDIDEIKLLDTQVQYDQQYIYNISAITMVFGTQYNYRNMKEGIKTLNPEGDLSLTGPLKLPEHFGAVRQALGFQSTGTTMFNSDKIQKNKPVLWPEILGATEAQDFGWNAETWGKLFLSGDLFSMAGSPTGAWFTNFMDQATTARDNSYPQHFAPYVPGTQIEIYNGITGYWNKDIVPGGDPAWDVIPKSPITNYSLTLDVLSRPSVKVLEVPYYSLTSRIVDKPPLSPIVSITPYMGVNDTFLVSLDSGTGRIEEEAIALLPSDDEAIEKQLIAQQAGFPPIFEFRSDDPPAYFELFRIDKPELEEEINSNGILQYYPPTSYQSFTNSSFYKQISAEGVSSASTREKIQPNKKYYYTFRSIDIHGNISNPSPIFEVKIVDDGGTVYLETKVYNFEIPEKTNVKSMRKYINIIPTMEQTMHVPDSLTPPALGTVEPSIWDTSATFKIRLTSKQTGKKLDLNINFEERNVTTD